MSVRDMGKTVFADLRDGSGRIQLFVNKNHLGDEAFDAFKFVDLGDHVGVEGELFTTRTGEISIRVATWTLLSKALQQPPEKFHGLQDVEDRYRQRYFDLIANPESRARFNTRIAVMREIRAFLESRGFQEVETPMMQPQPGGAAARPFTTHYNALDCTMYMRIAPELYLKRLLVGGFDKVFEMNRNFRNEGLDRTHNPEFTVLEIYEAYGDRLAMKAILEGMIPHVCDKVLGTRQITFGENVLDFTPPYREVAYHDLVREHMGADWFERSADDARAAAEAAGVSCDPKWDHLLVTHEVYDKLIEKTLFQPTFVTRVPRQFIPLAKACPDDPTLADVFEFVVAGRELCPGYTEQNDPIAQREAFAHQAGDEVEKIDEDFIAALEAGMPPAGGLGLGIDRFVMMLTGTEAIRDVILFPQLKQKA
jgi:lysyl-tRNA synthetase class 2